METGATRANQHFGQANNCLWNLPE